MDPFVPEFLHRDYNKTNRNCKSNIIRLQLVIWIGERFFSNLRSIWHGSQAKVIKGVDTPLRRRVHLKSTLVRKAMIPWLGFFVHKRSSLI